MQYPKVATRDCDDCLAFRYNEETGTRELDHFGEPMRRSKCEPPPCEMVDEYGGSCCPKGKPDADIALWPHNVAAYQHYKRCKAVFRFPEDSVVEANAATIADVEDQWQRTQQTQAATIAAAVSHAV